MRTAVIPEHEEKLPHERHPPAVTPTHLGGELSTFGGGTPWRSAFAMSLSLLSRVSPIRQGIWGGSSLPDGWG